MAKPRRSRPPALSANTVWRQVRERRLVLGITQAELADLAGLSRTTVHHIEAGAMSVKLAALIAVADVLGYDVVLNPRIDS